MQIRKSEIIDKTKFWTEWWINQREKKLDSISLETMSINPFLLPFIYHFHTCENTKDLFNILVSSHLMIGHNTGFGKLIDEKILPNVFNTQKLDSKFRNAHEPFKESCFDEIDHIVFKNGKTELISLKAGKWTIQLTMAVQLNHSFNEIIKFHSDKVDSIKVGIFYGSKSDLTDKYEILRGINRGKNHDVVDLTQTVDVLTGKDFWNWLNESEDTQKYVLEGIYRGVLESGINERIKEKISIFENEISKKHNLKKQPEELEDWLNLLTSINQ